MQHSFVGAHHLGDCCKVFAFVYLYTTGLLLFISMQVLVCVLMVGEKHSLSLQRRCSALWPPLLMAKDYSLKTMSST